MWCCLGGEFYTINFVLSTELIMRIGHRKEIRKLTFRALVRISCNINVCSVCHGMSCLPGAQRMIIEQLVAGVPVTFYKTPMRPQALNITHTALPRKQKMAGCGSHFPEIDEWFQLVCKCSSSKYKRILVWLKKKHFLWSERLRLDFWEETVMAEVWLFLSVALVITKTKADD